MKRKNAFLLAESLFLAAVEEHHFLADFRQGVAVALSGGADSVLLLLLLSRLAKRENFPVFAVHVHHGIRGEEADRDALFCEDLANRYGVPFTAYRVDAVAYAKENKLGLEEAARNLRYDAFLRYLREKSEASFVATAHHAGDNLETLLFHLSRGSGLRGLAGIPPRRDVYLRPMLLLGKSEILAALAELGEGYVSDTTNKDTEFRRNFIREKIVPAFSELSSRPDLTAARISRTLRADEDYLSSVADTFIREHCTENRIPRKEFSALHTAISSRVLMKMIVSVKGVLLPVPEQKHIESAISLARFGENDFRVDIQNGYSVYGDRLFLTVSQRKSVTQDEEIPIKEDGVTVTADGKYLVCFADPDTDPEEFMLSERNVYRLLKQIFLSHDTIKYGLCLRPRRNGDTYRYGGMTHKLKTLCNSMKLTKEERESLRVLCDEKGILYVPGFSVRDGETARDASLLFYVLQGDADIKQRTAQQRNTERHGDS